MNAKYTKAKGEQRYLDMAIYSDFELVRLLADKKLYKILSDETNKESGKKIVIRLFSEDMDLEFFLSRLFGVNMDYAHSDRGVYQRVRGKLFEIRKQRLGGKEKKKKRGRRATYRGE